MLRHMKNRPLALGVVAALLVLVVVIWGLVFRSSDEAQLPEGSVAAASSAAPSSSTTRSASIKDARAAVRREGSRVVVLSDGSGSGSDGWINQWGRGRDVSIATWDSENNQYENTFGARLWSGAQPISTGSYAISQWGSIWPQATPNVALISYGYQYADPESAINGMDALYTQIRGDSEQTEVVIVLQPPKLGDEDAEVREAIARWARETGLPTIDVARAFAAETRDTDSLLVEDGRPNEKGQEIWVAAVTKALGE